MLNRPGPRRPYGPALWAGLVVVALLLCTATFGRAATVPTTGGAGWLPADGSRQRFAGPDGVESTEWAVDQAVSMVGSGPAQFVTWLGITKVDWGHAQLARLSTVRVTSQGQPAGRSDDLFSLGSDGVRAEVESGFDGTARIYLPGRLDLPDFLAAGRSWNSQGTVMVVDAAGKRTPLAYRADYKALQADSSLAARACVVVTMREQVGRDQPSTTDRTWCRHAGLASWATPEGRWQATTPTVPAAVTPDVPFDWSTAVRLDFTQRQVNVVGAGTTLVSAVAPPGILPDGTAVVANQLNGDVIALQTGVDPPPSVWRSRPGVRNTAAATLGTTTVVASVNRHLVAYGPDGAWLWDSPLPDLSIVTPVRLDDLVITATLDGSVTAYDLATGAQLWQRNVGSEVRVAPQVAGRLVLVVDQAGGLSCFDAAGAVVWTADVGRVAHFGVTNGVNPVVVLPHSDSPRVTGLSLAEGRELWRPRQALLTKDVIVLDDVVVLRAEDESIGIDPATGKKLWSWQGARSYAGIGGGDHALLLARDKLVLLDAHGEQIDEWPVDIGDVSSSTAWLTAAQGRVLVYGIKGVAIGVTR